MDDTYNNECGSCTAEFREKVLNKVNEWFGNPISHAKKNTYEILFIWHDQGTAYVTVKTEQNLGHEWAQVISFLRLFEIGGTMNISQDKRITL